MYIASFTVRGWKRYECVECGCVYRCRFERRTSGGGETPERAEQDARREAASPFINDWDDHPCPECGLLQPCRTSSLREERQSRVCVTASVSLAAFIAIGALSRHSERVAAVVAIGALLSSLCYWIAARIDPNRDPEANKERAKKLADSGKLIVLRSGTPTTDDRPPLITLRHTALIWLAAFGFVLGLVPIVVEELASEPIGWVWGVCMVGAGLAVAIAGWGLAGMESRLRKQSPAALVARLDGKDGDVILLPDDPDAPLPSQNEASKPWERGAFRR